MIKLVSSTITHKSDVGGAVLDVRDADEVRAAFHAIAARLEARGQGDALEGVQVQALVQEGIEAIVVLTFREGCVGETVAALEAREALDHATDPEVRAALERIAADEQRHAELAWRVVSWGLARDARLRPLLDRELSRLEVELYSPTVVASEAECPEHGVLSERRRGLLRRAAVAEVALPCLRQVLALPPVPSLQPLA